MKLSSASLPATLLQPRHVRARKATPPAHNRVLPEIDVYIAFRQQEQSDKKPSEDQSESLLVKIRAQLLSHNFQLAGRMCFVWTFFSSGWFIRGGCYLSRTAQTQPAPHNCYRDIKPMHAGTGHASSLGKGTLLSLTQSSRNSLQAISSPCQANDETITKTPDCQQKEVL